MSNYLNLEKYSELSDKDLIENFKNFNLSDKNTNIIDFASLCAECIKRSLDYNINENDINIFKKFVDKYSLNTKNNYEVIYSFALYSLFLIKKKTNLHVIYINKFLLSDYYEKLKPLYKFLNLKAEINLNYDDMIENKTNTTKEEIYKSDIIFANLEEFLHDYLINKNIERISDRVDFKFETAFIFDIDSVLYDRYDLTFKINGYDIETDKLKIKDFFKLYKNILGVSPGLFFENISNAKKYNLKIEKLTNKKDILTNLKEIKNLYFINKKEKIKNITQSIKELLNKNKTIIIDANDNDDLLLLESELKQNKIKYNTIYDFQIANKKIIAEILTEKKVTILANLTSVYIKPELGGDYEYIAKLKTESYGIKENTNFYKEKYKSELKKQKEQSKLSAKKIKENNSLYLFFTSKYPEIKNEYLTINNYKENINIENITIYNSPEDELYQKFRLNKLSILNSNTNEQNEILYRIIDIYTFYLRKIFLKKIILEKNKYIEYTIKKK